MPNLDEFMIGPGGNKPAGERFKLNDFLLEVPAQQQAPVHGARQLIPNAFQTPQDPRELLTATSGVGQQFQAGAIAAGETTDRALSKFAAPEMQQLIEQDRPSTQALRDEFGLATGIGDVVPALGIPGGPIIGGAAAGALFSDDELSGALFGAAGGALGALSSRVMMGSVTPFPRGVGQGLDKSTKKLAKELGVTIDLGDQTGNRALKNAITALKRNPLASGPFDIVDAANKKAFNAAALRSIGAKKGDRLTADVLENARKTLSDGFETIGKRVRKVEVGDQFLDDLTGFLDEAKLSLGVKSDAFSVLESNVDKVLDVVGGDIDGRALTSLSSTLGKRAIRLTKPSSVNTSAGDGLFKLKELVDDLFEENAGPAARRQLTDLRTKWANLRTLRARNVVIDGDIQLPSLRSTLQTKDPDALLLGGKSDNELFKMARLQESVRDLIGNSGTPTGQAFDPGNILTSLPQRAGAKALNDPVVKFFARNNLLPKGLQDIVARGASRAGAVEAAQFLD